MESPHAPDQSPAPPAQVWWRRPYAAGWATALVVALAAAVRIAAANNDLWLDEIWSCALAHTLKSAMGVFTALHHDNNHYLNTLYLYLIGEPDTWIVYRLLSLAEGIGAVVLAAVVTRQRGRAAAVLAALLIGGSFLMTHYASEARGYAGAVFFGFLGIYLADRFTVTRRRAWACAFALSAVLGFLSHLTYLQAYMGLAVWTAYRCFRCPGAWWGKLADLAWCHALPIVGLVVLYVVDLRIMKLGGGPQYPLLDIATGALSLSMGGPASGPVAVASALIAIGLAAAAVVVMWRSGSDLWVLFITAVFVSPTVMIAVFRPIYLFERYFLVSVAFLLLSLPWLITAIPMRSRAAVVLASLGVAVFLTANGVHTYRLVTLGRGGYVVTLKWIAAHSRRPLITIGSNQDFQNGILIEFYGRHMPPTPRLVYLSEPQWPVEGPEWFIANTQSQGVAPPTEMTDRYGVHYDLAAVSRYAALSGWHWFLYHNRDDGGAR
ncbi:MAG: hypothetical protein K8S99_06580 [Planctomycetes bacterium]|nr:hypothetical protein [Planctomycetota bacterium]